MSNTKIKASQFHGVVGHGTDGYFLMTNGDGSMTWVSNVINPTITNVDYPGTATAADPAGGETITLTGTNFKTGATVTIGGTSAPSVSYVSATELTITTPAKTAGDYDIVVTNTDGGSATFVNGISYNGVPTWTTAAGSLGTFASEETISTITLQASEPDAGTITFNITNGALPTGLSLTGANIDGTTSLETADTLYTFTVTATDDENQATPRTFTITVQKQFISFENFTINTYTGNGSTQSIEGKIGTAAEFDGSSSQIDLNYASLGMGVNDFSYSFWFKAKNTSANQTFMQVLSEHVNYGIRINDTAGHLGSYPTNSSGGGQYITGAITIDTDWHHVAYVKSSTNGHSLWYDGTKVAEDTNFTGDLQAATDNKTTFGSATNDINWFNGYLDQVRFFNKGLSSSEISTLAAESNTSTTKSTTDIFADASGTALYEFEKGAIDTGGTNGYIGSAGVFDGSSSYIETPSLIPVNDYSFSCWVYFDSLAPASNYRMIYEAYKNTWWYLSIFDGGKIATYNGTSSFNTTSNVISAGQWYHIVYTSSSTAGKNIYLNGNSTPVATTTNTTGNSNPSGSWEGFGKYHTNSYYMHGKIDQTRIFNRALTTSEVTTLYGETSASATKSTTDIFDDGSGVALYELEGNANDTGPEAGYSIDGSIRSLLNGDYFDTTVDQVTTQSISFWAKIPTSTGASRSLVTTTNSSGDVGFLLHTTTNNNELSFLDIQGGATSNSAAWASTESDLWKHFVIVLDGTEARVYENNTLKVTVAAANVTLQNGGNIRFGAGLYYGSDAYLEYKHIRTYARALNTTEINTLYTEDFTNLNVISSPQSWFNFDNNSSGSVNDKTGNYTGTISGMTYTAASNYDGTATNVSYAYDGTPTNVSFVGTSFQPDLVWIKERSNTSWHILTDSVRGANKTIYSNDTYQQESLTNVMNSFDTNGFTVAHNASYSSVFANRNNETYVAWCWKAGGTAVTDSSADITADISANTDAGFSIVKYTGNGLTNQTIPHGLNSSPTLIITKCLNDGTKWWGVNNTSLTTNTLLRLDSTSAEIPDSGNYITMGNTSTFTVQDGSIVNGSLNYIAYCFHSVDGYQKIGGYTGNASSINTISVGFAPRFVMFKRTDSTGGWRVFDSTRGTDKSITANSNGAEYDDTQNYVDFTSDGFEFNRTVSQANPDLNSTGATYIYLAIA